MVRVEDMWDETEKVKPPEDGARWKNLVQGASVECFFEDDEEDSDAPLHFNLSDPEKIR